MARPAPTDRKGTALTRPRPWLLAGVVCGVAGLVTRLTFPWLESLAASGSGRGWRFRLILERLQAYPDFFLGLALLCLAGSLGFFLVGRVALREVSASGERPSVEAAARKPPPRPATGLPSTRGWLGVGTGLLLLWGAYISHREWVRFGCPCWDGYCDFATVIRDLLLHPGPMAWQTLHAWLDSYVHANSPVGPLLVALLGLVVPDIPTAFRLASGIATLLTGLLVIRISRRDLRLSTTACLTAALLFLASGPVQRSLLFPQTDALAMVFFIWSVERLLALRQRATPGRWLSLLASVALSLFTKLSALPILAVAAVVVAWPEKRPGDPGLARWAGRGLSDVPRPDAPARRERPEAHWMDAPAGRNGWGRSALARGTRALVAIVIPLAVFGLYATFFHTLDNYRSELHARKTGESALLLHTMPATTLLLPLAVSLWVSRRRRLPEVEAILLGTIAIYLLGLWSAGASAWDRMYLIPLPLVLALTVARLAPIEGLERRSVVALLCVLYALGHGLRMVLGLGY